MRRLRFAFAPFLLALGGCRDAQIELYHAASEREAVRILDALHSNGVHSARKITPKDVRKGAWRVLVAEHESASANRLINTLPGVLGRADTNLVEVVSGSGFTKTPAQVQAVHDLVQAEKLARQIETFPHVLEASVTLDRAASLRTGGSAPQSAASASAVVLVEQGWSPESEADVRKTLRFGVSGLADEHLSVTVTFAAPRAPSLATVEPLAAPAIDPGERWITIALGLSTLALALRWWASSRAATGRALDGAVNGPIATANLGRAAAEASRARA